MGAALPIAAEQSYAHWATLAADLGARFDARAAAADERDAFVANNYEDLAQHRFFALAVPAELGGAGLDHRQLGDVLRELGRHCASTALAFAMHTHVVAALGWRWRNQKAPLDALLKRIADEQLVMLSSGGSDWLHGSGRATRVDGGFRVDARKVFASGAQAADLLMTMAVHDDPQSGPTVLHVAVPMKSAGVRIVETWRTLGMRGTGSHDVELDGVFVPDAAVSVRRPVGRWHPSMHVVAMIALPLICAVYVGVAQSARDIAVSLARKRRIDAHLVARVGALDDELAAAKIALAEMFAAAAANVPGPSTTNRVMAARTLVTRSVLGCVDCALEVAGGAGFYRDAGLERRFRDAQAVRFHPLQQAAQLELAGRLALGLDIDAPAGEVRHAAQ